MPMGGALPDDETAGPSVLAAHQASTASRNRLQRRLIPHSIIYRRCLLRQLQRNLGQLRLEASVTVTHTRPTRPQVVGLFLIPTFFALLQGWATQRIILQLKAGPMADGSLYIEQARLLQDEP